MNNRQNGRRRGRGGQPPRNGQPGVPDRGSRLDNRARGNAAQLLEKYRNLARDAQMVGDRVNTEYYLQFADHYFRVLSENRSRFEDNRPEQRRRDEGRDEFGREDFSGESSDGEDMAGDADGEDETGPAPERGPRANGWQGRDFDGNEDGAAPVPPETRRERAPRETVELPPRAMIADEGERYQERRPRRARTGRGAEAEVPAAAAPAEAAPVAERIEVDRLPQGFGTAAGEPASDAPAPRRRAPRRPRPEATTADV